MTSFRLPNLHANWPFKRVTNELYSSVSPESFNWFTSFDVFNAEENQKLKEVEAGYLGALAYPFHSRRHFRVASDLMVFLFAMDDISDELDGPATSKLATVVLDALK
jgi:hypothetical protein